MMKVAFVSNKTFLKKKMIICNVKNAPVSVLYTLFLYHYSRIDFTFVLVCLRRCPVDDSVQFVRSSDLKERKFSVKADDFLNNLPQVNRISIIIFNSLISQNCMLGYKFFQNIFFKSCSDKMI